MGMAWFAIVFEWYSLHGMLKTSIQLLPLRLRPFIGSLFSKTPNTMSGSGWVVSFQGVPPLAVVASSMVVFPFPLDLPPLPLLALASFPLPLLHSGSFAVSSA